MVNHGQFIVNAIKVTRFKTIGFEEKAKNIGEFLGDILINIDDDCPNNGHAVLYNSLIINFRVCEFKIIKKSKKRCVILLKKSNYYETEYKVQKQFLLEENFCKEILINFKNNFRGTWKCGKHQGLWVSHKLVKGENTSDIEKKFLLPVKNFESFHQFLNWIVELRKEDAIEKWESIFRGHNSNEYKLTTSFHRTKKVNLVRYWAESLPKIVPELRRLFDTEYSLDLNGLVLLMGMAQHYSFPTLTCSP